MKTNAMSALGRMGYGAHLMCYPAFGAFIVFGVMPWNAKRAEANKKADMDAMIDKKAVDPDLFSPFTPIPYHNNPELKYVFAHINMRKYVNQNHINVDDYVWKNYHHSYDHDNKKSYTYNWVSIDA